jgi:hypothetical protein
MKEPDRDCDNDVNDPGAYPGIGQTSLRMTHDEGECPDCGGPLSCDIHYECESFYVSFKKRSKS